MIKHQNITEIIVKNNNNFIIKFLYAGTSILEIICEDKNHLFGNVVLRCENIQKFLKIKCILIVASDHMSEEFRMVFSKLKKMFIFSLKMMVLIVCIQGNPSIFKIEELHNFKYGYNFQLNKPYIF